MASIRQRPDGMYRARYRDAAGREHARHFRLRKEAQHWLNEQTAMIITGTYASPQAGKITVQRYFDTWTAAQIWADNTLASAKQALASSELGTLPIGSVKPSHIRSWLKREHSRGIAASTVALRLVYVNGMFSAARQDRIIATNPAEGIKAPKEQRKPAEEAMIIPTAAEVRAMLDKCEPEVRPMVLLGVFAGLRRGELAAVRISDIDFLRRRLKVERQAEETGGGTKPPKGNVTRFVYLPDELLAELSRLVPYEGGWLLPSSILGRCPSGATVAKWWDRKVRTPAGLRPELTLHSLRHYFASGLIAAGCDVVTVQHALGHASPTITLSVYAHLWPSAEDKTRDAAASIMAEVADSGRIADPVRTKSV